MGQLLERAKELEIGSIRAIAYAVRDSPLWPDGDERSAESIANKLRDVDKGKELSWLVNGAGKPIVPALAEVLGYDVAELFQRLNVAPESGVGTHRSSLVPFSLFPALRPLDLDREMPFPGVPEVLLSPDGPAEQLTLWIGPPGAGKTLVGRYLEHRFGWRSAIFEHFGEMLGSFEGRWFVELASTDGLSPVGLRDLRDRLKGKMCLAMPDTHWDPTLIPGRRFPLPAKVDETKGTRGSGSTNHRLPSEKGIGETRYSEAGEQSESEDGASQDKQPNKDAPSESEGGTVSLATLSTPSFSIWWPTFLEWADTRLIERNGGFSAIAVRQILATGAFDSAFATPGDLIGFLGVVDQVGTNWLTGGDAPSALVRVIKAWLDHLVKRDGDHCPPGVADLLRQRGADLLLQMTANRMLADETGEMSIDSWALFVPAVEAPAVDRERMLQILEASGGDANARLAELRAALRPDGRSVIKGLWALRVLEGDAEHLTFRQQWTAMVLELAARARLFARVPEGLGALLLQATTAGEALAQWLDEPLTPRLDRIVACLDIVQPTPERLAALDGAFRVTGLSLLFGDDLPVDLVKRVWQTQMRYCRARNMRAQPLPLVGVPGAAPRRYMSGEQLYTHQGTWTLAALQISLCLHERGARLDSPLSPWGFALGSEGTVEATQDAFFQISQLVSDLWQLEDDGSKKLVEAVHRFGGKYIDSMPSDGFAESHRQLAFAFPDMIVLAASVDSRPAPPTVPAPDSWALRLHFGLEVLDQAAARRAVPVSDVLTWCWQQWLQEPGADWPYISWVRETDSGGSAAHAERLWRTIPTDAIPDAFCIHTIGKMYRAWPWLSEAVWRRVFAAFRGKDGYWRNFSPMVEHIPQELAVELFIDLARSPDGVFALMSNVGEALWRRAPEALWTRLESLAREEPPISPEDANSEPTVWRILRWAPDQVVKRGVDLVLEWTFGPDPIEHLRRWGEVWLMLHVERRRPGWRKAAEALLRTSQ